MRKFKSFFTNKTLSAVVALALVVALLAGHVPQDTYAADPVHVFKGTWLPTTPKSGKNEWQIIDKSFPGLYNGSDVTNGWDTDSNASYSIGDGSTADVRMTNTVISTSTENEFIMYTSIEPRVSWQEVLELNTIECTNSGNGVTPPAWLSSGHVSYLYPDPFGDYQVPIYLRYYADMNSNGKHDTGEKYLTDIVTMYAKTQNVPNGTAAFGNPLLTQYLYPDDPYGTFGGVRKFDISAGEVIDVPIDAKVYNKGSLNNRVVLED